jgi:hypothetical protein
LELVDDALHSAAEAGTKTSKKADERFQKAIETLSDYEMDYRASRPTSDGDDSNAVHRRMEVANAKDESASTILNRLKESLKVREDLAPLLRRILIPISSRSSRSRRRQSSFSSTSPFLIRAPPS